jgi:hypothetical protein
MPPPKVQTPPAWVRLSKAGTGRWSATIGGDKPVVRTVERDGDEWVEVDQHDGRQRWWPTLDVFRRDVLNVWVSRWISLSWRAGSDSDDRAATEAFVLWARARPGFVRCDGRRSDLGFGSHSGCCLAWLSGTYVDGAGLADVWVEYARSEDG